MKHMAEIFKGKEIVLDGNEYEDCQFYDCRLVYEGGTLPIIRGRSTFDRSRFAMQGEASRTLNFMIMLYSMGAKDMVEKVFDAIRSGALPKA